MSGPIVPKPLETDGTRAHGITADCVDAYLNENPAGPYIALVEETRYTSLMRLTVWPSDYSPPIVSDVRCQHLPHDLKKEALTAALVQFGFVQASPWATLAAGLECLVTKTSERKIR